MNNQAILAAAEELSRALNLLNQSLVFGDGSMAKGDIVRQACQVSMDAAITLGQQLECEV